jgi:hypothetical protein
VPKFYEIEPTLENYWRSIILLGRNVASYKFALAKALYDLKDRDGTVITLDTLAVPFAKHISEHLVICEKQGTSANSKFLDGCRDFNANKITHAQLIDLTVRYGFNNVIDAFHYVHNEDVRTRFLSTQEKLKAALF